MGCQHACRKQGQTALPGSEQDPVAKSDADLVSEMAKRNGSALELLHCRYREIVRRIVANILRDETEAEDVTQEVFLEVFLKAHLYDQSRGTVRVWLMQYAYHRGLRRKAALRLRLGYSGIPLDNVTVQPSAAAPEIAQAERGWFLRASLACLPKEQREVLEMACFEDLPMRDIADRLGVSLGNARHYYYRGLAALRRSLVRKIRR